MSKAHAKSLPEQASLDDLVAAIDAADERRATAMLALQRFGTIPPQLMADHPEREAIQDARAEYAAAERVVNDARQALDEAQRAARHAIPEAERRRVLAEAIAAQRDTEAAVLAARTAEANVRRALEDARAELDAAQAGVAAARQADARAIEEAAATGTGVPGFSVRAARVWETAAHDALEAATTAVAAVEARLASAEGEAKKAAVRLSSAVANLATVPIAELFGRAVNLQAQLNGICGILALLLQVDRSPDLGDPERQAADRFVRQHGSLGAANSSIGAWRETVARLAIDAATPFPSTVGGTARPTT